MTPISLTCPAVTGGAFHNERCIIARSLRFSGGSTSGLSGTGARRSQPVMPTRYT